MSLARSQNDQTEALVKTPKQVNCIFAIHFDDENDPRYQEIVKLVLNKESWDNGNLVTALHCDSLDNMINVIEGK
ncbi:hypothetical protein [Psychrobacter sanguinis]|uniref:hypothetical protein n=1 Tax=Psychrobacter sanguinis TaxID=861445 RepID=UPI00191ACCDD|nr:hypothetical protein [Psychrobacter sanguinis]MDY3306336.1 hypothetical protein [Psychrobacter sanguinis]UEC24817.1 hypothetical protein LK453_09730 [Psychrobacter sanguinis]